MTHQPLECKVFNNGVQFEGLMGRHGASTDIAGQAFGRFTVIKRVENAKDGKTQWLCKCECGTEKVIKGTKLRSKDIVSCGCYRKDKVTTHGHTRGGKNPTRIYSVWQNMKDRCSNIKNREYKNYGGRGIIVCEEWQVFENFLDWYELQLSEIPEAQKNKLFIDRKDNDGGYFPGNCRLVDRKTNNRNRRVNIYVEFNGEKMCLKEAVERFDILGIGYDLMAHRRRLGWTLDEMFNTPKRDSWKFDEEED